jgi:hypothetical protein
MRLWTAIMGWAGLMAAAIALYALGVALESKPHAPSSALMASAIGLGAFASLIFAGDLVYLARKERQRRRALRGPPAEYGALDYEPEFTKASARYTDAQRQIAEATTRTGEVFARNQEMESQAQADECGNAAQQLCEIHERLLPEMSESAEIARQCLRGFLKVSRPANDGDRDALRELRSITQDTRKATTGYLRSMKGAKKTTARLRKKNLSRSLNESAHRLQGHLRDSIVIVRRTIRGFRAAERQMTRRLTWYAVLARLPHSQRESPKPPAPEPRSTVDE